MYMDHLPTLAKNWPHEQGEMYNIPYMEHLGNGERSIWRVYSTLLSATLATLLSASLATLLSATLATLLSATLATLALYSQLL